MFELKLADNDVTGGSIPVTWCVDQELLKELADNNVRDPYVVIVVAPDGSKYSSSKEVRKVVPLKDLMTYVDFRVPGKNKIFAFVSIKGADTKTIYLSRENTRYNTDILNFDGTDFVWSDNKKLGTVEPILLDVPVALFAKEPASWEKKWVNLFFSSKLLDQCSFRRRRIFAYTLQPFVVFTQYLAKVAITLFALLFGARNFSVNHLAHPIESTFDDYWTLFYHGTIFIRHLPEDEDTEQSPQGVSAIFSYAIRSFWSLPFMPLFLMSLLLLAVFHPYGFLIGTAIVVTALTFVGILLGVLTGTGSFIVNMIRAMMPSHKEEKEDLWYLHEEEIGDIVCSPDRQPFSYKTLPGKRKSIKLRFQNIKSKVCRPFSA